MENELEKLLRDSEALCKRWKAAAGDMCKDDLSMGQIMVSQVFAANVAFHKLSEELASRSFLPDKMKPLEFF